MKKYQSAERPWPDVARELSACLSLWAKRSAVLANDCGIDYQAIRRMMRGSLRNKTENAVRLCNHFQISLNISDKVIISEEERVMHAFRDSWDGTVRHAEFIIALIECTRTFTMDNSNESK